MAEEWISITEAAARLTSAGDRLDRSTLSRYLAQHAEALPLRPAGGTKLVEYESLARHRRENVRLRPGAGGSPRTAAPAEFAAAPRFAGTQADAAARDRLAIAEMREMDLAERRRELTPVAEVDAAGREAVVLMGAAFDRAIEARASDFALKYGWDERQVRVALKAFVRDGLEQFRRAVLDHLDRIKRVEEDGRPGSAGASEGAALQ